MQATAPTRTLQRDSTPTIHYSQPPNVHYVQELMASAIILAEDWEHLSSESREELLLSSDKTIIRAKLVEHGLLTDYQAGRLESGTTHGLVLGSYRVLSRLGAGNMGVVFKAEHRRLRRLVAIKVVPIYQDEDIRLLDRFFTEMRAVAHLQHPNIVSALDAGECTAAGQSLPTLHYFVMEYVPGEDLEEYVYNHGTLSVIKGCDLIHQVASALAEAHKHHLVHRDIKPSNVRVTPEEQAKLLDFGLARQLRHRLTTPGTLLGTIDYMAPEQTQDASAVDIRADIYGLGGTLFWCLTGQPPFHPNSSVVEAVARRLTQGPPSSRSVNPEIPVELDGVIRRMMALKPDDRYSTPEAVMQALLPFLQPEMREHLILSTHPTAGRAKSAAVAKASSAGHKVLIVDDEPNIRQFCRFALESQGLKCDEADNGQAGLDTVSVKPYDLVLLDIHMPKLTGLEVLRSLRKHRPVPHLKVVMFSGQATSDELAQMLLAGADGYLTKPFSIVQLVGQVKASLRLKDAQTDCDLLNQRLMSINADLERALSARASDLLHARNALVLALASLVAQRDGATGSHVVRLQRYCRCLAEEAASLPTFANQIDANFIDMLDCCLPLHDIGKVGLPDYILMKPGRLTPDERVLMETHTIIGADTLTEVAKRHGSALVFLKMAIDIARHHHERFDGTGYPDRLAGTHIPLSARIVAVADVYDALRSRRIYKPALSHAAAKHIMLDGSPGHFDPALLEVFQRCASSFEQIFSEMTD
jgi:response regulator RpfG family c-di-GMP phosphodiesterase